MATDFGTKIAINWICVNDRDQAIGYGGGLSGRPTECRYCRYPAPKRRCHGNHFGRPFVKTVRPTLSDRCPVCPVCLSVLYVCNVGALWPNGWIDQDETWHAGRPRPWPVLDGDPPLPPKRGTAPNFRPICCGQMAGWIKMPLAMQVGLVPGDFVLDGDPDFPLPKKGAESAHVYCGQTAGWINMALGMEVSLNPGDFVLDGAQPPSQKGGGAPFPNFRPISIVAKRLDGSRWNLARRWALVQATLC